MAFSVKLWKNDPDPSTPLSAAALQDLETRLSAYTDSIGGGVELGYAESASNFTQTGAGTSDITGLAVTVTVGARPIVVYAYLPQVANSSASGIWGCLIRESSTTLQSYAYGTGTTISGCFVASRLAPSAGSHTYKASLNQAVTGNTTITCDSTKLCFIQVVQV